jgi:hypothetical protein
MTRHHKNTVLPKAVPVWGTTLRKLNDLRKELTSVLGNIEMQQAIWEKQYWRVGDEEKDQKLAFEEVERQVRALRSWNAWSRYVTVTLSFLMLIRRFL